MSLWQWPELCQAVGAPRTDGPDIDGVSIDSRTVARGDLFVALPGDPGSRFFVSQRSDRDGHDYVTAAFDAGAAGALVQREAGDSGPCMLVPDTIDALWGLASAARERLVGQVVAVTGSSGKTTVKTFISRALDAFATGGSLNNHLGVPLSLARTPPDSRFAVYEIGTSHPGEIAPLARMAAPDVAAVLNVHPAHIEYFDGIEALLREKLSISEGLRPGGKLVCLDTLDRSGLDPAIQVITFGREESADVRLISSSDGIAVVETASGRVEAKIPGGGEHRAMALTATAAVIAALNGNPASINRIGPETLPAGRGDRVRIGSVTLIDDSYNANPGSMSAALETLAAEPGRTIAVLGEMLELGDDSHRHHAALAEACGGIDQLVCVGSAMEALYDRLPDDRRLAFFSSPDDIDMNVIVAALQPGDHVLIKGSNRVFWARGFVRLLGRRIEDRFGAAVFPGQPD